jgi:hypothetical protein
MAKKTFNPSVDEAPATPAAEQTETTSTAVVVREERTVALPSSSYVQTNEFQGEIDPEETLRPTLGIVPKVGRLADLFTPGDLFSTTSS